MSQGGRYVACGSDSGIVNVYDGMGELRGGTSSTAASGAGGRLVRRMGPPVRAAAKPMKALMSLTTPIDVVEFNSQSEILAIASRRKKDSLKLVHLPTMTTFANWPTSRTPLHYVTTVDFSPSSGFLAVGNSRGRVLLYRVKHYAAI